MAALGPKLLQPAACLLGFAMLLFAPPSAPFIATDSLGELPGSPTNKKPDPETEKRKEEWAAYLGILKQLEEHGRARILERARVRLPFTVVSADATAEALKGLKLTAPALFTEGGRLKGRKFDLPDTEKLKSFAARVHADAVLTGCFDEPRKSNGHFFFDPLAGAGYESPKVTLRGEFAVYLADGSLVLKYGLDEAHPLTQMGKRQYLAADWMETQELAIEDLMDELTRYTPLKPAKQP
jgi:hypothetical protein